MITKNIEKQKIFNELDYVIECLFYWNRKGDPELPVGSIQNAIKTDILSVQEIVGYIEKKMEKRVDSII